MSIIKSEEDLDNLRYSARILMSCHHHIKKLIKPGVSAYKLDKFVIDYGEKYGAKPNFLGYHGFKHALTVSINDEVVHGLASTDKILPENGLVKIDMGFIYKGMHSDAARTYIIGDVSDEVKKLVKDTELALWEGIKVVKSGIRVGDIGYEINKVAKQNGYGNVWQMGGHGLGYKLHDDPYISNIGKKGKGLKLFEGKLIALEPMFNLGTADVDVDETKEDGWTVKTKDGSWSAHVEHDILVTKKGYEVITDIKEDKILPL